MKKHILIPYEKYCRLCSNPEQRLEPRKTSSKAEKKLSDEDILSLLPERLRDKGKQFFHFLKTLPSVDWDEKEKVIIDGNVLNFSHITDFIKDTLQPGKPIEHLETWYGKLSDSVPLSLVYAQRRPYVIKGRDLEKAESQKGFGDQRDQAHLKGAQEPFQGSSEAFQEPFQEPSQDPSQDPSQEPSQESFLKPSQEPSQEPFQGHQKSAPVQDIIIPRGYPTSHPKKFILK